MFTLDITDTISIKNKITSRLKDYITHDVMFSYMVMNKSDPSKVFIASTYPQEWIDIYKQSRHQYIDPVVLNAINSIIPFSWADCFSNHDLSQLRRFFMQSSVYGLTDGFTFLLHDYNNNLAMLSFLVGESENCLAESELLEKSCALQKLLMEIHNDNLRAVDLKIKKNSLAGLSDRKEKKLLTPREYEVLAWAGKGKTNAEIGIILSVSVSTVKFHTKNIIAKFGVLNIKHAIRLGTELKIISP